MNNRKLLSQLRKKSLPSDASLEDERALDIANRVVSWMNDKEATIQEQGAKQWEEYIRSEDPLDKKVVDIVKESLEEVTVSHSQERGFSSGSRRRGGPSGSQSNRRILDDLDRENTERLKRARKE